ncbi:zonular occludens toxin domain-containing protein [Herbaspirillum sp. GCM10030257]|uniref:zonular occludens toxin domain-containing protein n=1 Tax=Herbaspirillum sp. GCM10030257 TaxID=3273393 RepID=UPI00360BD4D6
MINLMLGAPGGGKSYEAVAFHVIPALASGRKVITNLPLVLDSFPPEQRSLLKIVTKSAGKVRPADVLDPDADEISSRPFACVEDYGDPWRHPENGSGPLYVIDECHLCLPRMGTQRQVAEWFSLHRHEYADVLLISQSHGKVNKDIVDLVQVMYRVRKATAFGSNNHYIRKVFDGVRGDCMNTNTRTYDKKFFKYYRSHTKSSSAGQELTANDIVPIWKRWPFIFGPIFLITAIALFARNGFSPVEAMAPKPKGENVTRKVTVIPGKPVSDSVSTKPAAEPTHQVETVTIEPTEKASRPHPFHGYGLHIAAYLRSKANREMYLFEVSQNGQPAFSITSDELKRAGYKVSVMADCVAKISYEGVPDFYSLCDTPKITMAPGKNVPIAGKQEGKT